MYTTLKTVFVSLRQTLNIILSIYFKYKTAEHSSKFFQVSYFIMSQ